MKLIPKMRCSAIVKPGEYLIDRWNNKQCEETSPYHLVKCDICNKYFCATMHWYKHNHEDIK